jgi:hypothetical protein
MDRAGDGEMTSIARIQMLAKVRVRESGAKISTAGVLLCESANT